ncbi:hypothetical protein V8D89_002292 [Ganoderma adspersum]
MLRGAISPANWARFQGYAERVRIATIGQSATDDIHFSVWVLLAVRCRGSPLMPRLREFRAHSLSLTATSHLTLLLSPTLRLLSLSFGVKSKEENRLHFLHIAASLLQILPPMVPDLEHLTYRTEFNLPQEHLQSFTQFKRLKSLSTPSNVALNKGMLEILSSVPTLQNLSCWIDLSGTSALALPHAFLKLTDLNLRGDGDHFLTFVLACHFPKLARIELRITQPPSVRPPQDAFSALSQRCDPTLLTSFVAEFTHQFTEPPRSLMEYFRPLLVLRNMTTLRLVFRYTEPSIRDDDLVQIGAAWPRLSSFRVEHSTGKYSERGVSAPTLLALVAFALRCPFLTNLYIPELDPRNLPEHGEQLQNVVPRQGHALTSLGINNIRPPLSFDVYMDVATVLDRAFPSINLEEAESWMIMGPNGKGWLDILRLMKAMRVRRANGGLYADLRRQG